jgi:hypothetical protein
MLGAVAALAFFWWIIWVVLWALFLYVTFALAVSKGRSPILWVILAIFFPLITVIVLLILPNRSGSSR